MTDENVLHEKFMAELESLQRQMAASKKKRIQVDKVKSEWLAVKITSPIKWSQLRSRLKSSWCRDGFCCDCGNPILPGQKIAMDLASHATCHSERVSDYLSENPKSASFVNKEISEYNEVCNGSA